MHHYITPYNITTCDTYDCSVPKCVKWSPNENAKYFTTSGPGLSKKQVQIIGL